MLFEDSESFSCPYCASDNSLSVDVSGGSRQRLIVDCETCCRPIVVDVRLAGNSVRDINVSKENE